MLNEGFERVRESPWPLAVPALALVIATPRHAYTQQLLASAPERPVTRWQS